VVVVIPVYDVNPVRRTPWVTYALIAINIGVFLVTPAIGLSGVGGTDLGELCQQEAFFQHYGAVPDELIGSDRPALVPTGDVGVGPSGPGCIVAPPTYDKHPILSVLTAMFLHGGWLHLLGNMLFLWVFGNNVEDRMGHLRYLGFYLLAGYAAAYGFALVNAESTVPLVGASGAIAGVLGAYIVLYPKARVWSLVPFLLFLPLRLPAWLVLGVWFLLQWFYTSQLEVSGGDTVAYLAHVVGFLFGVILALPLRAARPAGPPPPAWPPPRSSYPGPARYP
jgi:membrane associated rhomboid family serine protease